LMSTARVIGMIGGKTFRCAYLVHPYTKSQAY
jgi:hypothetical protein